ncbi:MAG TPA: hypothetical protein DIW46_07460 [Microbacterium sp.]|nr:hypothetical protein [Microbacterium sp.]
MVYHERAAWAGIVAAVATIAAYVVLVLGQAGGGPLIDVDWLPLMLWSVGGGIVLSILITILWGIVAGIRDRESATASDVRDRDISRFGGRVEYVVLCAAGIAIIVLCAVGADVFWIANTMFLGFAVSTFIGTIARVIVYRRGLV